MASQRSRGWGDLLPEPAAHCAHLPSPRGPRCWARPGGRAACPGPRPQPCALRGHAPLPCNPCPGLPAQVWVTPARRGERGRGAGFARGPPHALWTDGPSPPGGALSRHARPQAVLRENSRIVQKSLCAAPLCTCQAQCRPAVVTTARAETSDSTVQKKSHFLKSLESKCASQGEVCCNFL